MCPGCATSLLEVTTNQLAELPALVDGVLAASPVTRDVHATPESWEPVLMTRTDGPQIGRAHV